MPVLNRDVYGNPIAGTNAKAEMIAKREAGQDPNALPAANVTTGDAAKQQMIANRTANPLLYGGMTTHNAEIINPVSGAQYRQQQGLNAATGGTMTNPINTFNDVNRNLIAQGKPVATANPPQPTVITNPEQYFANAQALHNSMFGGMNYRQLGQASQDYISGLMSGQTQASRAMQADEAKAMGEGIQNLLNNISATSAATGITGGELSRLYGQGIQTISNMMGDFALKNIERIEQNQANGFDSLLKMYGADETSRQNMISSYSVYKNLTNSDDHWKKQYDLDISDRMIALMQDNPALAPIYSKYLKGEPLSQADIDAVRNYTTQNWTMADLGTELAKWKDLGIATTLIPRKNADGTPALNGQGQQIYDVEPKLDLATGTLEPAPESPAETPTADQFSRTAYEGYPAANYEEWKTKYVDPIGKISSEDKDALTYFAKNGNATAKSDLLNLINTGAVSIPDYGDKPAGVAVPLEDGKMDAATLAYYLTPDEIKKQISDLNGSDWTKVVIWLGAKSYDEALSWLTDGLKLRNSYNLNSYLK